MIQQLFVNNYILIENLQFDFKDHFSVITGETGAGKSIFLHALSLILGQRLNKEVVGPYDSKAIIEAVFEFESGSSAIHKLQEAGFEVDGDMIFSRVIDENGKSTYRINRQVVNLSLVKDILEDEIDIHSQFNTQGLLDEKNHINYIDQLVDDEDLKDLVKEKYQNILKAKKDLKEFISNQLNEFEIEQLKQEIERLESLELSQEEYVEITEQLTIIKENENTLRNDQQLNAALNELDYESLYPFVSNQSHELLTSAYYQLIEVHQEVEKRLNSTLMDEEVIASLNERAYVYSQTSRRLNRPLESILSYIDESKELIHQHQDYEKTINRLQKKIDETYQDYLEVAKELSLKRKEASVFLSQEIMKHAQDLSLNHLVFDVNFIEEESSNGLESAQFLVSTNKGIEVGPLSLIASGGELSRIMLALKVIFNQSNKHSKLIVFDEIDTGVSGKVAQLMGLKMHQLAQNNRVLSVTHLPIIAAFANQHYLVYKDEAKSHSQVFMKELNEKEKLEQIALMMSSTINETSLLAAKQLQQQTQDIVHER